MKIEVGKILKAQGIKGEVKLECFLDNAAMLKGIKQLYVGSRIYTVEYIRPGGAFCYIKFAGVNDRNIAEAMQNWIVCSDKENIVLPQNRYFVQDLLGCTVKTDSGEEIGKVVDVLQYGAADVFVCHGKDKKISFPFVNGLAVVNVERKSIVVDSRRFAEVALYED